MTGGELSHNDIGRAVDLDTAHVRWSALPLTSRPTFGSFAIGYLRGRGLEVTPRPIPATMTEPVRVDDFGPYVDLSQALAMTAEDVADLLAALAERDLHWTPGRDGECGVLHEGQAEPPDLHVVFDCFRGAWQRDDRRARDADEGDPAAHWFGPDGTHAKRLTWPDLRRYLGPLTPDGRLSATQVSEGGTLHEGQAEPPDGHVVFDAMRAAWQRDDARATAEKLGDYRWFGSTGLARMWADLRRDLGPLTPDGGIPPTTPDPTR